MHAAHEQNAIVDGLLLVIIVAYLGIAFQFWTRRRGTGGRATTALSQLVIIFVFCAFCGYLPRLVDVPEVPLIIAHAILAAAAWAYLFAGQVDRLSIAVDDADREGPNPHARRREERQTAVDAETEACIRLAEESGSKVAAGLMRDRLRLRRDRDQTNIPSLGGEVPSTAA